MVLSSRKTEIKNRINISSTFALMGISKELKAGSESGISIPMFITKSVTKAKR